MLRKFIVFLAFALILISAFPPKAAHADVAPPEAPPGTNLIPGNETTQVRMVAETVILTISKDPADSREATAKTEAIFTMRNLGTVEENMQVRFPLSFFNGNSDGFGNFPEIDSIAVKIDGKTIQTKKENQPFFNSDLSYRERDEIPWAVFEVSFPPSQDVTIEVTYTVNGFGYYPYENFKYILETGAGWNGTIGAADVIVRLPYEVNKQNVWAEGVTGYTDPTQGGVMSGSEIRWHFEELEPTWENNIQVIVVTPSLWESVLKETDTVTKNPNDGEAWGRLAKAYKEILRQSHGELRADSAGRAMFELSKDAYEKCLALLPNDSLWHYGYAELLWAHYYFDLYWTGEADVEGILPTVLTELQTVLALDSNNQQAKDLLAEISYAIPNVVRIDGDDFVLLGLTATPIPPTPYLLPSETPQPTLTETTPAQQATTLPTDSPTQPTAKTPLCGSAFLLLALIGMILAIKRG
jgi:hypothetical protein